MKKAILISFLLIIPLFSFTSCNKSGGGGGSPDPTPSNQKMELTDDWLGTYSVAGGSSLNALLKLTQTGNNVTGTFDDSLAFHGVINGTVDVDVFRFSLIVSGSACDGTYSGIGEINSSQQLAIGFNGRDCLNQIVVGQGLFSRN